MVCAFKVQKAQDRTDTCIWQKMTHRVRSEPNNDKSCLKFIKNTYNVIFYQLQGPFV